MVICFVVDVQMMRFLIPLFLPAGAIAQIPLIAVNSAEAELPAGARDVVASITVDPSAAGGDFLAVMLTAEGVRIEIEGEELLAAEEGAGLLHATVNERATMTNPG